MSSKIFRNKTIEGLYSDIYDNHNSRKAEIHDLLKDMVGIIKNNSAAPELISLMGQYITSLMSTSVKNDEQLIKLVSVIQKTLEGNTEGAMLLTENEKEILRKNATESYKSIENEVKLMIQKTASASETISEPPLDTTDEETSNS